MRTRSCCLTQLCVCVCVFAAFVIVKGSLNAQGGQVPNMLYKTVKYLRDAEM